MSHRTNTETPMNNILSISTEGQGTSALKRPGISQATLKSAGVHVVTGEEAETLIGFKTEGLAIPYHDIGERPLTVNEKHFHRVRLSNPLGSAKYLSPKGSGAQLYIPKGQGPTGATLIMCEGEFKALALAEIGILAVGLGGITSALPGGNLLPALATCIKVWNIDTVAFLGDADTSLIYAFSHEAVKIKDALPEGVKLVLPRVSFTDPKGIDDCKEAMGGGFQSWLKGIVAKSVEVSERIDASSLALKLIKLDLKDIAGDFGEYKSRLIKLSLKLGKADLDQLASEIKKTTGIAKAAFIKEVTDALKSEPESIDLPEMYFDGSQYYRPRNGGYDAINRGDAFLELGFLGFSSIGEDGGISPREEALHRIQVNSRVHFAGAICGRPVGMHKEGETMVLATSGPNIIEGKEGDSSAMDNFVADLLGRGQDEFALIQLQTFAGWLKHFRSALRNHDRHQPGQALALVGGVNCGKSLLQQLITLMVGGRGVDASLYLLGDSNFNKELWAAEHLFLDDDKLGDNGKESHAVRDRLKKLTVASTFLMHGKCKDAVPFRPIWRTTISANLDDESINVLPPPDESFGDKIIYLKCYPPSKPFHDGSDEGRGLFWKRLNDSIAAFLDDVDSYEIPEARRASRFAIREFHHPDVLDAIQGAASESPLGELIDNYLENNSEKSPIEDMASNLFEILKESKCGNISAYSTSVRHFGHQLSRLSKLPRWKGRIEKIPRRIGDRSKNQLVNYWRLTALRSNAD